MRAVVFDLDDTLYPEIEFVKSGFRAVARHLSLRYQLDEQVVFSTMLEIMTKDGRGKVFDTLLESLDLYTEDRVRSILFLYRSHRPKIRMYKDVIPTLKALKAQGMSLAIITDGMASVQRNKLAALRLTSFFDVMLCSDELGHEHWKPAAAPYRVVLELLQVSPEDAVYIGDNIRKDFAGPNKLGMLSIQLIRPGVPSIPSETVPESFLPKVSVTKLEDIIPIIAGVEHVA